MLGKTMYAWVLGTLLSFSEHTGARSLEYAMVGRELQVCSQNSPLRSHGSRIPTLSPTTCKNVSRSLDGALRKWPWQRTPVSEVAENRGSIAWAW